VDSGVARLVALLRGRRFSVLTGAGCSTDSGIPDYRGEGARVRPTSPVQFQMFRRDPAARRRYWARSVLGWPRFSQAEPNAAHRALSALDGLGALTGLVTQNVDGLHQAAGTRDVVELHGALARARCLECGTLEDRSALQERLLAANPGWPPSGTELLPDGDASLDDEASEQFVVVSCLACGGVLKPDVVFFGENVQRPVVERAYATVMGSDALMVVGSSLQVFSGYRFVKRAAERRIPVVIVNRGPTRGDGLAALKLDAGAGETLAAFVRSLGGT
jgi:NAD-dependent SIR2 family protein deacetylase